MAVRRTPDPHSEQRAILAAAYHNFRERAALIAAEIPQDLREYTVHDVTHLDALWELATQLCGEDVELTPTEAFVLGGAFLIHDLGMGLAAWPGGLTQLTSEPTWVDTLANCIRQCTGEAPTLGELEDPPEAAQRMALEIALRERHAFRAADLALSSWTSKGSGAIYHLIEDTDLRERYGELIGEIAASHWWDIRQMAERFSRNEPIGAPVDCPQEWTVDELKLACLMRVSDAAHLDERRAPGFLRAVRSPGTYSDLHWAFQGYLQRPRRSDDRMVYTSARAFGVADAQSWWVCFESLEMVDRELRAVDSLLVDRSRTRFAVRGVRGIESPSRLADYIRTSGWNPVDARPRIDNVPALIRKLGGESLYGLEPRVALRELIQNARDASTALEALLGDASRPILVELSQDEEGAWYFTISDSGVGMSGYVLSGVLLDFGESFWGSDLMRRELPGLGSSQFSAVGRFGIGFYSVFMLGDHVTVISRRYDEASAETKVLEFLDGVGSRPILRPANASELKHVGGTSVRVKLRIPPTDRGGLLSRPRERSMTLAEACAFMAPALDCDLSSRYLDEPIEQTISANDWLSMPGSELLRRICEHTEYDYVFPYADVALTEVANNLTIMETNGVPTARISMAPSPPVVVDSGDILSASACVVIGGLRAGSDLGGVAGIVTGAPTRADRMGFRLDYDPEAWAKWASDQAVRWSERVNSAVARGGYTEEDTLPRLTVRLGGDPGELFICRTVDGNMSVRALENWIGSRDAVTVVDNYCIDVQLGEDGGIRIWHADDHCEIELDESIIVLARGGQYGTWDEYGDPMPDKTYETFGTGAHRNVRGYYHSTQLQLEGLVLRTIADAWSKSLDDVLARATHERASEEPATIGRDRSGIPHTSPHVVWRVHR